jgi:hypothetical protein
MSETSLASLSARVDALEKCVQSLLGAVKMLETLYEKSAATGPKKKARKPAAKKHAARKRMAAS